ncbi:MAG: SDR family oxidoreductase [Flavipsychrobacter sp.]|nr:SDR family oxidoreductase [Flavipsychrobacter sp.]
MEQHTQFSGLWAVILGGSGGFGYATAHKLALHGMNIAVVYRETAIGDKQVRENYKALAEQNNITSLLYNINALDDAARTSFIDDLSNKTTGKVKVLLHAIARGNLKPLVTETNDEQAELSMHDIQLTTYAMSNSLLDWVRDLLKAGLFHSDARVIGLTSEGVNKYWDGYAAVSIAKASLQSLTTYMAVEFGKYGIKTNLVQAGITETLSLKKIPGSEQLLAHAAARNPAGRITQPGDVANAVYLLCTDEAFWINGALIHVDGGEHCK